MLFSPSHFNSRSSALDLACFFFLAIPPNKPVARISFMQFICIEIRSVCIWVFLRCKTLVLAFIQVLDMTSCVCPGVGVNSGPNSGQLHWNNIPHDIIGGMNLALCVCDIENLGPHNAHAVLHLTSVAASISYRWSDWFRHRVSLYIHF